MTEPTINITFRHMDHSPVFEEIAYKELAKLNKFLTHERPPCLVDLIIEAHPVHAYHQVEIRIKSGSYNIVAHDQGPDMYVVLDSVIKKASSELERAKNKMLDHNKRAGSHRGL